MEYLRRVEGSDVEWWLYGSAALAVRGIEIMPGDIDVNVDDASLAGELLDDVLVTPVEELDGWVARRVGRAFCGAIVEWLLDRTQRSTTPRLHTSKGHTSRICSRAWSGVATASGCRR